MKKHDLSNVTVIPAGVSAEAKRFIPRQELQQLTFWSKLKERDQDELVSEINALGAATMVHRASGLAIGKHIRNIYGKCEAYSGAFRKIMAEMGYGLRQAYRYMDTYANAEQAFPEPILKAAMIRGLDVLSYDKDRPLGKYTEVVRLLPPPRKSDIEPAEATRYIEQLEQTYKDRRKSLSKGEIEPAGQEAEDLQRDPELLMMQNFRGIKNALKYVPTRQRKRWFEKLVGMSMHQMGLQSAMMFEPEAPPEHFKQGPGRPSINPNLVLEAV
jgi:hypothetical protein